MPERCPEPKADGEMNLWRITFFWDTSSVGRYVATPETYLEELARIVVESGLMPADGPYDIQAAEYLGKVVVDRRVLSGDLAYGT